MHYYKFNIADWMLGTAHLTLVEEAIYFRLVNHYYDTEAPIPLETQSVFRRLRLGSDSVTAQLILEEFFTKTEKGYVHTRCDENIKEYKKQNRKNASNGAKGGRPRKDAACEETQEKPTGLFSETQEEPKHNPNQEPLTTNQEPLTNNKNISATPLATSAKPHVPVSEIIELFNATFPELPQVMKISEQRRKVIRQRWLQNPEMQTMQSWEKFFKYVRRSDFLMGRSKNPWSGFCFDWMFNQSNFTKIYEGNYHQVEAAA